jgi:hypothetical protein
VHLTAPRRTVLSCFAAAFAAAALTASSASAAVAPAPASGCPAVPTVQPFAAWQDVADYVLAPEGGIESGGRSWTLAGGARAVEGNEPFRVGATSDHQSLALPAGSSATTAPMCIGIEHRTMRFFGAATRAGELSVQALYRDAGGRQKVVELGTAGGRGTWAPSDVVAMKVNELAPQYGNALAVSLRFTPRGASGWLVDDVYVDPFRSR